MADEPGDGNPTRRAQDTIAPSSSPSATGGSGGGCSRAAQAANDGIEGFFERIGRGIARCPVVVLLATIGFVILMISFVAFAEVETELFDLWTPTDSPVHAEREFLDDYWADFQYGLMVLAATSQSKGFSANLLEEDYIEEWLQIHMEIHKDLPKITLDVVMDDTGETKALEFGYFAEGWETPQTLDEILEDVNRADPDHGTFDDPNADVAPGYASEVLPLCRPFAQSPLEAQFQLPCYVFQLLDCFAEGGYLFPYEDYLADTFVTVILPDNPYAEKPSFRGMSPEGLGKVLGPSCDIWTGTTIPFNYLYGGDVRVDDTNETSALESISAFESIFFLDSSYSLARKILIARRKCRFTSFYSIECPEPTDEEQEQAEELLNAWLLEFIEYMKDFAQRQVDDPDRDLELVFWTPRTAGDLLDEASSANIGLLVLAYVMMIVFAGLAALRPKNLFISRAEASTVGVLLVLMTVGATVGFGGLFVKFSPNVIQVLPFIALGFGVDDMFVLLFSFRYREAASIHEMIAETTRVAGSSVALTSVANFFGFMVGSLMPLPDVSRFAQFGMIMVAFNFLTMVVGFTAIMTLVARRMKGGYNDFAFLCCFAKCTKADAIKSENHSDLEESMFDPLFDFLTLLPVRIVMLVMFCALFGISAYGMTMAKLGLPLDEIVPTGTYASDFLTVRQQFFFSYVVSLYSDAQASGLTPIEWPVQFESFVERADAIYEVSDLVYDVEAVHDFWAWKMRDYFKDRYERFFFPFSPERLVVVESLGKSFECDLDRRVYCPSLAVDYTTGSDLFQCLRYNYDGLSSEGCQSYINDRDPVEEEPASVAKQVEVKDYTGGLADGLYLAPSTDETNVFWTNRDDPDASKVLFQRFPDDDDTAEWLLLGAGFTPLYRSRATSDKSPPPQFGWMDYNTNETVLLSVVYFDASNENATRSPDFIDRDVAPTYDFVFHYAFDGTQVANGASCMEFEVWRKEMRETTGFSTVNMSDGTSEVKCVDYPAAQICSALAKGETPGAIQCTPTSLSSWWQLVSGTDGAPLIVGNQNGANAAEIPLDGDDTTGYQCGSPPSLPPAHFPDGLNFLAPCSADFGGFGIQAGDDCSAVEQQEISLTCNAVSSCTTIEACFAEFVAADTTDCDSSLLSSNPASSSFPGRMGRCLFPIFDTLSDCCQEAIKTDLLTRDDISCTDINDFAGLSSPTEDVCLLKDECQWALNGTDTNYYCEETCLDDVWVSCSAVIAGDCASDRDNGDAALLACLNTTSEKTACCQSALDQRDTNLDQCIIPVATYYNASAMNYSYAACETDPLMTPAVWMNLTSSTGYNGTADQLYTLQSVIENGDSGFPDSCCKRNVDLTIAREIFTRDCAADVPSATECNGLTLVQALNDSDCRGALEMGASPNCRRALSFCAKDGDWGPYGIGDTPQTLDCPPGFVGTRTRMCVEDEAGLGQWEEADEEGCAVRVCPEDSTSCSGFLCETWPATNYSQIAVLFGTDTTSNTCGSQNKVQYAQRECKVNETGDVEWGEAARVCRGYYGSWSDSVEAGACDEATASVLEVVDVSEEDSRNAQLELCKDVCELDHDHCVYININYVTQKCYIYDYCERDENGDNTGWSLFAAPLSITEFVAQLCASASQRSDNEDFQYHPSVLSDGVEESLSPSTTISPQGIPHPFCWGVSLWQYMVDPTGGVLYRDKFVINNKERLFDSAWIYQNWLTAVAETATPELVTTTNSFAVFGLDDDEVAVKLIEDIRGTLSEWESADLSFIPGGLVIDLFTQYVGVNDYMLENLLWVALAITIACFLFLWNPLAVSVVLLCDAAMIVEVYGFVEWAGLRVNGVLALNIVIAIGLTMEFTAHMARAFVLQNGENGDAVGLPNAPPGAIRMKKAYREMFDPVSLGAVTTFLGVLPVAFADFPYFQQYYFVLYVMIVSFGWLNGVIFLPMLLSFVNPQPFHEVRVGGDEASQLGGSLASRDHEAVPNQSSGDLGGDTATPGADGEVQLADT